MFWIYRIIPHETGKVTRARIWTTTRGPIIVIALGIAAGSGSHLIQLVNVNVIAVTIVIDVVAVIQIIRRTVVQEVLSGVTVTAQVTGQTGHGG